MPITVKTSIKSPSTKKKAISAVDIEGLRSKLDKLPAWGHYTAEPSAVVKTDKAKKVTEVTVKSSPVQTLPKWNEYGKTTDNRKAEWDRMYAAAETYVQKQHETFTAAVDAFVKEGKSLDLDKAAFDKLWKEKKKAFQKALDDHASKTSKGETLGVKLDDIPPDPVETKKDIKAISRKTYDVSGASIEKVFNVLDKRKWWGRYRSNEDKSMEYALDGNLKKITVKGSPKIWMPKWKEYSKGTKEQKKEWDRMWKCLETHELEHHNIFTSEVDAFTADIESMELKKAEAEKHWKDSTKDWQTRQNDYDSTSDHGGNEGVHLDFNADP